MNEAKSEQLDYKNHYKKILTDLISQRNSVGFLENEEAIEDVSSNPESVIEEPTLTGLVNPLSEVNHSYAGSHEESVMIPTFSGSVNFTSFKQSLENNSDDESAVFCRKSQEVGSECVRFETELLHDDLKRRADKSPLTEGPDKIVSLSLTPEPSLMAVSGEERGTFEELKSDSDGVIAKGANATRRNKIWKFFKNMRNSKSVANK